MDEDLFNKLK